MTPEHVVAVRCGSSCTCLSSTPKSSPIKSARSRSSALDHDLYLRYAEAHRDVIARFGRFPHRNAVLGRVSTEEERAWLDAGGGF